MRLIDADALTAKCGEWYTEEGTEEGFIGTLKSLLDEAPTVDAIPTDILHTRCHSSAEQAFQRKMFGCLMIVPVNYKVKKE